MPLSGHSRAVLFNWQIQDVEDQRATDRNTAERAALTEVSAVARTTRCFPRGGQCSLSLSLPFLFLSLSLSLSLSLPVALFTLSSTSRFVLIFFSLGGHRVIFFRLLLLFFSFHSVASYTYRITRCDEADLLSIALGHILHERSRCRSPRRDWHQSVQVTPSCRGYILRIQSPHWGNTRKFHFKNGYNECTDKTTTVLTSSTTSQLLATNRTT